MTRILPQVCYPSLYSVVTDDGLDLQSPRHLNVYDVVCRVYPVSVVYTIAFKRDKYMS